MAKVNMLESLRGRKEKNMTSQVEITSSDYWFKVVEMLQQNWALIEPTQTGCVVYFISDTSGVFDQMEFSSVAEAKMQLQNNGFRRYAEDKQAMNFIVPPQPPFHESKHPNGAIYSSGKFWRTS